MLRSFHPKASFSKGTRSRQTKAGRKQERILVLLRRTGNTLTVLEEEFVMVVFCFSFTVCTGIKLP